MTLHIAGTDYEENLDNKMGLQFYDLSHPWGLGQPCWPYFEDVKIERLHSMAKSGVLTQRITTVMHSGTHIDAPAHVVEGTAFMDEVPLPHFFGTGVVVSIPKQKWEVITAADLEAASPQIREGDIVIVNTGWHKTYGDNRRYYAYSPGFYKEAGEWFAKKKVKMIGTDTQALDHPLGTAIGPHGPGWPHGLLPDVNREYERETGRKVIEDFPEWEPCHQAILKAGICGIENVGGEIDKVTGKRVTFAAFPWRWTKGDGCIVRLVAIVDPSGRYRIESGSKRMKVTRFADAAPYVAPNHHDMRSLRLQGFADGGPTAFWTGLSHFLPGGGAGPDASPLEKVYVMLAGELTITAGGTETVLKALDSCCIPGGEVREVENRGNGVATMLVVMPYPSAPAAT